MPMPQPIPEDGELSELQELTFDEGFNDKWCEEMIGELEKRFQQLDADNSGMVDRDELKSALQGAANKMTDEEIQQLLDEFDMDANGGVDLQEFITIMHVRYLNQDEAENDMLDAFRLLDRDGDGVVTSEELHFAIQDALGDILSDQEAQALIAVADESSKGGITFEDFEKIVNFKE